MRAHRLVLPVLIACGAAACTDSTGPADARIAPSEEPRLDGGFLGNGGRTASDSISTSTRVIVPGDGSR